jgi:hypothetical protein
LAALAADAANSANVITQQAIAAGHRLLVRNPPDALIFEADANSSQKKMTITAELKCRGQLME